MPPPSPPCTACCTQTHHVSAWLAACAFVPSKYVSYCMHRLLHVSMHRRQAYQVNSCLWDPYGSFLFALPLLECSEAATCTLLSVTLAWHPDPASGVVAPSLDDACRRALVALEACNPPAPPAALVANPAATPTPWHDPDLEEWTKNMQRVHDALDALDGPSKGDEGGVEDPAVEDPLLSSIASSSLEEWMRGGQGSLDDLLGVLNGGIQDWGGTTDADALTKVVMARCTTVELPHTIDPLDLLAILQQSRDPRCYQFALLPEPGTVFFGSSPEQLFARNGDAVASEAVAATRPRGAPGDVQGDFWLALDLLRCGKDHREFVVVRDWVRDALQEVCEQVAVEREKSVLKHGAVQHLYGKLAGRLRDGCDDAAILVCMEWLI